MSLTRFKTETTHLRAQLSSPGPTFDTLRAILTFLQRNSTYADDVDYRGLCVSFTRALKHIVNPFRHRTVLEKYREPAELAKIRDWLGIWIEGLSTLECSAREVADWHRRYDTALYHVLSALLLQRRGRARLAAEAWTEAATVCREWLDQNAARGESIGYKMLEADYHFFEARAGRAQGEDALDRGPRTSSGFDQIAEVFAAAHSHMVISDRIMNSIGKLTAPTEVAQLEYLAVLCRYRSALLKRDFPAAHKALGQLKALAPDTRMPRLPYFGESANVECEEHFVKAFEGLAAGQVSAAKDEAEKCVVDGDEARRQDDEGGKTGGVRERWLLLRKFALRLLSGETTAMGEIEALVGSGFGLGQASRFIADVCRKCTEGQISSKEAAESLAMVFPLDAYPPTDEHKLPKTENLEWLPPLYGKWLEDLSAGESAKGRVAFLEWQYLANVVEYLCGLYRVKRERREVSSSLKIPSDLRLDALKKLKEHLDALEQAVEWRGVEIVRLRSWVGWLLAEGQQADLGVRVRKFQECIKESGWNLFPHVVKMMSQETLEDGRVSVRLERIWQRTPTELELMCLGPKGLQEGKHYFLKAPFKLKLRPRYDEEFQETFNIHRASTFSIPRARRWYLLVEGEHDAHAFTKLLDAFLPYWKAQIELEEGGGDSLPNRWQELKGQAYQVIVVADADKKGKWDGLKPLWLTPDFEGVDPEALSEAVQSLWGRSIIGIDAGRIREVLDDPKSSASTVARLREHFRQTTRAFIGDENEMKRQLRDCIADIWVRRRSLPGEVALVLFTVAEKGFGLAAPEN